MREVEEVWGEVVWVLLTRHKTEEVPSIMCRPAGEWYVLGVYQSRDEATKGKCLKEKGTHDFIITKHEVQP